MGKLSDLIFFRRRHVCPRWLCFTFDDWARRLWQKPDEIIGTFVKDGDTVLDVGPGIGFFTIPMAKKVGERGLVIAADIQQKMLDAIKKRASRAGVEKRIKLHLVSGDLSVVETKADFILTFWMAHEAPSSRQFFIQLYALLKDEGKFLLAEPKLHVSLSQFENLVQTAQAAGFQVVDRPKIALSMAVLLAKH